MLHTLKTIIIPMLLLLIMLAGCYRQTTVIDEDGGTVKYDIVYYYDFENLLTYVYDYSFIDLNTLALFDKDYLTEILSAAPGYTLRRSIVKDDEAGKQASVEIDVENFDGEFEGLPLKYFPITVNKENLIYKCTVMFNLDVIDEYDILKLYNDFNSQEKGLIDNYAALINFEFVYRVKGTIMITNQGEISTNKNELKITFNLLDYLNGKVRKNQKTKLVFTYRPE